VPRRSSDAVRLGQRRQPSPLTRKCARRLACGRRRRSCRCAVGQRAFSRRSRRAVPISGNACPERERMRAVRSSTHVEGCGHRSVPAVANGRLRWAGERAISCRHHHHGKACLEHALLGRRSRRSGSLAAIILTRCRSDAREAMRGQISLPWRRGPHLRPRRRHSPLSVKFKYPTASPGQRHSARSPRGS